MAIKSGRLGNVKMGVDAATAADLISINNWTLSLETEKVEVTCFLDTNRVYLPGMRDISGTLGGFYNAAELKLVGATDDDVPSHLELIPDTTAATASYNGLAYLSCEIEVPVSGAPTIKGTFNAAGPWTLPTGT
jgi:hypothetical protein